MSWALAGSDVNLMTNPSKRKTMSKKPMIVFEASRDDARQAWIYQARGKFIGCEICYDFLEEARDNITPDTPHVVMELSGITMLNSTGIGVIASLYNTAKLVNGQVYVIGASDSIQRPISVTHLWEFLKKGDSLEDLPAAL
jgi:anti-anti-sigma factor